MEYGGLMAVWIAKTETAPNTNGRFEIESCLRPQHYITRNALARPLRRAVRLLAAALLTIELGQADAVTDWNEVFLRAVRNETTPPPLAARNLAILHCAIYDAVNAISRTHQPCHFASVAKEGTSIEAAAASTAHQVAMVLYPSRRADFEALLNKSLAAIADGEAKTNGIDLGVQVARETISWRAGDNSSTAVSYLPSDDVGRWRRTPPFFRPPELPQWRWVTPFALTNVSQFQSAAPPKLRGLRVVKENERESVMPFAMTNAGQFCPPGPPGLNSPRYARDFNEVKKLGSKLSTNRTPEQAQIARFWSDFSYTVTPPGHWNEIARTIVRSRKTTLEENARIFALLNIALADAAIVAWDAKYIHDSWRPVTAIQQADRDDNDETEPDASWESLLATPSHPEYPSGHSTFSGAAAAILSCLFGSDEIPFTVGCDALPGVTRSYTSLSTAAEEIGMSRIYGGIHFQYSNRDGLNSGKALGEYVFRNMLKSVQ